MAQNLVIVESPAKAKTIAKYLGPGFKVLASYGHVRDLVPKEGAVDPERDFAMKYELIDKNKKHVQTLKQAAKQADALFLATDPDREGEAISWHILEILKQDKSIKDKPAHRIVFHEITQRAVQEALKNPGEISMNLVNAQQARRALDYLVGFNLSPLLWRKIRRGLSAGRVQSPALRMIVEREIEIENFEPQEYWTIEAACKAEEKPFKARLLQYQGEKVKQFSFTDADQAHQVRRTLLDLAQGRLTVVKVEKKQRRRNPAPPFITSTLQQEAARKLGFTTRRTMSVAQQLYEGIDIGGETVGLITYMRTDSTQLAQEAVAEIRDLIASVYGKDNLPPKPRVFKAKSKNAQEAHEAIRPTSVGRLPEQVKPYLTAEQYKLYDLIWKRTVACQMIHATLNTVAVDLACGNEDNLFRATGSTIAHPGFMAVYQEGKDDGSGEDGDKILPPLREGQQVALEDILADQHFTEPPPRYTEASLVKALEEYGIGRPSTYASIISTLLNREYVVLENKRFKPTDIGRIVNKFLTEHFTRYVDYHFTAGLEDELDAVSRGEKKWIGLLKHFWEPFKRLVLDKDSSVQRKDVTQEALDEKCPECGGQLSIRLGRNGRFIGCTNFPECKYTRNLDSDGKAQEPETLDRQCPQCGKPLQIKVSRYGKFIGCSGYPKCRYVEPLEKPEDTGVECPQCHQGNLLKRKSRGGKIFYSCATYPKCRYAVWNPPLAEPCPECGWPILTLKTTKRRGTEKVCPQKHCGYTAPYEETEAAEAAAAGTG
ncbi:DNA topoisomerase I [Methylomarinovum caldicuralii]|uniref:DNA topoisomerase 1 n=1 Tax=Methylomarinovum caldicuralii TaxID=438856 RepID=A0AAU9C3U9_9GAMM|nr:type I DNA topoisomerase [Methylomarinovum caldicuralii]BCX82378.1 DNA topoisomerase I [Methylomarinovum caldicuralii]